VARRRQRWGWPDADVAGVRSPPLRGGASLGRMALRENLEIMRRAVFSEGRGLRARVGRLDARRGVS